jgi:hypothetical protein
MRWLLFLVGLTCEYPPGHLPFLSAHMRDWIRAKLRAGTSPRHLAEALAALAANLDRVTAWAGWVQSRLEDFARADHETARARERTLEGVRLFKQKMARWEQERAASLPGGMSLSALVAAQREHDPQPGRV